MTEDGQGFIEGDLIGGSARPCDYRVLAAQAWLDQARAAGMTVTCVGESLWLHWVGQKAQYRAIIRGAWEHYDALRVLFAAEDEDARFVTARGMYPDPGDIEGKGRTPPRVQE